MTTATKTPTLEARYALRNLVCQTLESSLSGRVMDLIPIAVGTAGISPETEVRGQLELDRIESQFQLDIRTEIADRIAAGEVEVVPYHGSTGRAVWYWREYGRRSIKVGETQLYRREAGKVSWTPNPSTTEKYRAAIFVIAADLAEADAALALDWSIMTAAEIRSHAHGSNVPCVTLALIEAIRRAV